MSSSSEKGADRFSASYNGLLFPPLSGLKRAVAVFILITLAAALTVPAGCRRPFTSNTDCASEIPPDSASGYIQECSDYTDPVSPWHVCITKTKGSRSKDVLFYFHGYSNDQCAWLAPRRPGSNYRAAVVEWWEANGKQAPTVVVFSVGRKFLLTPDGGRYPVSWFVKTVLPEIRKKLGPKRGEYIIWGTSMGGQNALQLYMRHPGLWDKAVFNSPMIPVCDPYAEDGGEACIRGIATRQIPFLTMESLNLVREFYPTGEEWAEADPLRAGPRLLNSGYPPMLIEIGTSDEFGFYPGADAFRKIAVEKGVSVEFIVHGVKSGLFWKVPNHLYFDAGRLARFIAGD
ncbi:MAG TPA: alpha/beta hydrolase-fold protein [Thermodesulfobacteriota bacterium]|nr:alpha/beta hydrolase-fold protein [Thermodesulfobacteriota bacterium]